MRRGLILVVAVGTLSMLAGLSASTASGAGRSTPLWVKHVHLYPGGISNGVRAYLDPAVIQAQAQYGHGPYTRAPPRQGVLPFATVLLPDPANVRGPDLQIPGQRADVDTGKASGHRGHQLRLRNG